MTKGKWTVCQFGAREHYAVAESLAAAGLLERLETDCWVTPRHLLRLTGVKALTDRFNHRLAGCPVGSWTWEMIVLTILRWRRLDGWKRIVAQNRWFAEKLARYVGAIREGDAPAVLFCYSYTAGSAFRLARKRGIKTVLGQIDGGIVDARLIGKLHQEFPEAGSTWKVAPDAYWKDWREELQCSDQVVVNSSWSKQCLIESGLVEEERIEVIPLAYLPPKESADWVRTYPLKFNQNRPLRVLFLGQVNLRKGILPLLEAAEILRGRPLEITLVGPVSIEIPELARANPRIKILGKVARSETGKHYQDADVFILPTYSDGFALTQLEAQAWKIPLIVSPYCGEVVTPGVNGVILPQVSAGEIVKALVNLIEHPEILADLSKRSADLAQWSPSEIERAYTKLALRL